MADSAGYRSLAISCLALLSINMNKQLTFVKWYIKTAIYQGDTFLGWFDSDAVCVPLLELLGYGVEWLPEIPTCAPGLLEFWRAANGWWSPTKCLADLKDQIARYEAGLREKRIASLESELAQLKLVSPSPLSGGPS